MRIPLVYGSSASLDNIILVVYHKNVPMIIQSLGSNGYLSLIYSLIAHSITLASRRSRPHGGRRMITKFIPKDLKRGVEDAAIRNNEIRLQIFPHLVLRSRRDRKGR